MCQEAVEIRPDSQVAKEIKDAVKQLNVLIKEAHEEKGLKVNLTVEMSGKAFYQSFVIVHKEY
jgi:hypothetical protein